jgi:tetratricopeptide (TPR) repeat protein
VVVALYFLGEYGLAVETAKRATRSYPDFAPIYRWLAAALGQVGRADEGNEALAKAVAITPASVDIHVGQCVPWIRQEDHAHLLEGLQKAGWRS